MDCASKNSTADCARCRIWTELRAFQEEVLHRDIAELVDGVRSGCWWCIKILTHLQDNLAFLPKSLQGNPLDITPAAVSECPFKFQSLGKLHESSSDYWWASAHFDINGKRHPTSNLPFFTYDPKERPGLHRHTGAIADNTSSEQTMKYVIDRLENCEKNHELCQQLSKSLPTRLVEIREEKGGLHFRLILTSNSDVRGPYITLSHRWGKEEPIKLTKDTLSGFKTEIPQLGMPQKFIDAAVIALRLGVQYLWIDSLCIIQNSDDWDIESGTMDLVYQNAYCNLAATSATSNNEGFFYKRCSQQVCPGQIRLPRSGKLVPVLSGIDSVFRNLDMEPLNLRGWVSQERLLSRRNISFSKRLVYFECAEELSCEVQVAQSDRSLQSLASLKDMPPESAKMLWRRIDMFYSQASITNPGDKLVALSGIAKSFQPVFKSEYLAGIWKSDMHQDLCWYPSKVGDQRGHVPDYRAPSWSWASVDGTTDVNLERGTELVDIVETHTTPAVGTNPYGAVQDSRIRLRGWVFPILHRGCESCDVLRGEGKLARGRRRKVYQPMQIFEPTKEAPFGHTIQYAIRNALDNLPGFALPGSIAVDVYVDSYALGHTELPAASPLKPVDCFFLPVTSRNSRTHAGATYMFSLILAATTPSRGVYQRIGLLRLVVLWLTAPESSAQEQEERLLSYLQQKFRRCQVPSYEGHTLEEHEITLV